MLNRAWTESCDTTKGNRWITVNTNPILNSKGTRLLARSGGGAFSREINVNSRRSLIPIVIRLRRNHHFADESFATRLISYLTLLQ